MRRAIEIIAKLTAFVAMAMTLGSEVNMAIHASRSKTMIKTLVQAMTTPIRKAVRVASLAFSGSFLPR